MEPMVTISLKDYNKLLTYSDMINELINKSKKEVRSEIIPSLGSNPKRSIFIEVDKPVLKYIYSDLLDEPQEDVKIFLGD